MTLTSLIQSVHDALVAAPAAIRGAARSMAAPALRQIRRLDTYLDRPVQTIYSDDPQAVLVRVANDSSTELVPTLLDTVLCRQPTHRRLRFKALNDPTYGTTVWNDSHKLPLLPSDL